jgi:hypothetical protein
MMQLASLIAFYPLTAYPTAVENPASADVFDKTHDIGDTHIMTYVPTISTSQNAKVSL